MKKLFPKCPICESEEGYERSVYYPNVKCKSCKAEWLLFEDGMELKRISEQKWDKELLNKKYVFEFWRDVKRKIIEPKISGGKNFGPMTYMGGHIDYREQSLGYILLQQDGLTYKTVGSLHKMDIRIPIEKFKGVEIRTGKEITFLRWFLIGAWSILFKKKQEYLVLIYEDQFGMLQHMVFDFHNKREMVEELITLVVYLKKKKSQTS